MRVWLEIRGLALCEERVQALDIADGGPDAVHVDGKLAQLLFVSAHLGTRSSHHVAGDAIFLIPSRFHMSTVSLSSIGLANACL